MAGMLSQAQESAQGQPTGQPQAPQNPQSQQSQQQPVESQEAYDLTAGQMLNFVYGEQGIEALTNLIGNAPDPAAGMARLFGRLLTMTTQSAAMAGKHLPPEMVFQAGIEVIRALSEVAQAQGLIDKASEKEIAETAFYDGMALFATEAKEEALTEEDRQQYAAFLQRAEELEQQSNGGLPDQQRSEQPQQAQQSQEMPA